MNKEKFLTYERIRVSGVTNMLDVERVVEESNNVLTRCDCIKLVGNYKTYKILFGEKQTKVMDYDGK